MNYMCRDDEVRFEDNRGDLCLSGVRTGHFGAILAAILSAISFDWSQSGDAKQNVLLDLLLFPVDHDTANFSSIFRVIENASRGTFAFTTW